MRTAKTLNKNGMNTLQNNYDSIERIIFEEGLRIQNVEVHKEIDKILIFLNTNHILIMPVSRYQSLKNASKMDLQKFEIIAGGSGIHWTVLDEDLSLKGFLKDTLLMMLQKNEQFIVA